MSDMKQDSNLEKCFNYLYYSEKTLNRLNFEDLIKQYRLRGNNRNRYPLSVHWKLTSACNLRCKHCIYSATKGYDSEKDLSDAEIMKLAKFFAEELQLVYCVLTGGEALLRKNVFQVIKYLKSKNIELLFLTNGTLVTEKKAKKLAEILNLERDSVRISLDGATKETHEKIRGKNTFEKTIQGIKHLINNGVKTSVAFVVTSANVHEIAQMYKLCKELNVYTLTFGRYKSNSKEQDSLIPKLDDVINNVAHFIDIKDKNNTMGINIGAIRFHHFLEYEEGVKLADKFMEQPLLPVVKDLMCDCHSIFALTGNGDMFLCSDAEIANVPLGNLREQSFYEIWENRHKNAFYQCRDKSPCGDCPYVKKCKGGCAGSAYLKYKTINAPDGCCDYGRRKFMESKC